MDELIKAILSVMSPQYFFVIAGGVLVGIFVGIMPGLSSIMGLTIMLPITFVLKGNAGILMMLGIYCGAIYGGSITACLINTPGTANSAATCLDGYPMAVKNRQPGRALGMSTYASLFGGLFSAIMLLWTAPMLAKVALKFSPAEYFALAIFGLSIVTGVSSKSITKGLLGGCLGLLLATIGIDSITGSFRFTFDSVYLTGGISFVPVLIGLFAFSQGLNTVEEEYGKPEVKLKTEFIRNILPSLADIKRTFPTIVRSSVIGTIIGVIPGTGGDIACWMGYNEAKRWSKHPEEFGNGSIEGIAAPESANNAVTGGALIPLLTLGIPGDAATAIMLGSLMMQGIIPGPLLFTEQTGSVYIIIVGLFVANLLMGFFGFAGINLFVKILAIPTKVMVPLIFVFCFVGTYALNHNLTDIALMIVSGILGYFLLKLEFSVPPIILGLILGKTAEDNLRRALVLADGNTWVFFQRPISGVLLAVALLTLVYPFFLPIFKARLAAFRAKGK